RELPSGRIGKLLVFKSGRVKLAVGDVLLDVSTGLPNQHRQDVVALNPSSNACVLLGDVHQRVLLAPDVMHLLRGGQQQQPQGTAGGTTAAAEQPAAAPAPAAVAGDSFRRAFGELPALTASHRRARGYEVAPQGGEGDVDAATAGVSGVKIKPEQ
ncbi:hypothetical protein Agub_g4671, partial [Astrephomene gubernaculifera]